MLDGDLTAIDNTRLLAARKVSINIEIIIHDYNSKIPASKAREYTAIGKSKPETWDEAINSRFNSSEVVYHNDKFYIVDGHHRYRAARMAGINEIPVKIILDIKNHYSSCNTIEEVIQDAIMWTSTS